MAGLEAGPSGRQAQVRRADWATKLDVDVPRLIETRGGRQIGP